MTIQKFINTIWKYYREHRRDLPWRNTKDPYLILVSEMMLQQTQVSRVLVKYAEFTKLFPSFRALSKAPMSQVLSTWKGLGYNRRAYFLKSIAEVVTKQYRGKFPPIYTDMLALPGVGQSTAGALCAFAFNSKQPFIETNIRSVYIDSFFGDKDQITDTEILKKIKQTLDKIQDDEVKDFYYALYDYGAMLKQRLGKKQQALHQKSYHYKKQSQFKGSNRQLRSIVLDMILQHEKTPLTQAKIMSILKKQTLNNIIPFNWNTETEQSIHAILTDLVKKNQIIESIQKKTSKKHTQVTYLIP